jgi:hypothetical protein
LFVFHCVSLATRQSYLTFYFPQINLTPIDPDKHVELIFRTKHLKLPIT